jgi:7-carboxy-7-deazaguanine synthase
MQADSLRITEIFYSLQGETKTIGLPTVFVRLTGCPLRCQYCDTEYAFHAGEVRPIDEIITEVASYKPRFITVTGGEPLAQPECRQLLTRLCDLGYDVSLETSGAMPINDIDPRVSVVLDLKTPASAESSKNLYENIPLLAKNDQVKFVICDAQDYQWAKFKIDEYQLADKVEEVIFSPSFSQLDATQLADWIVADNLPVRFQLQLHKLIWNDEPGR